MPFLQPKSLLFYSKVIPFFFLRIIGTQLYQLIIILLLLNLREKRLCCGVKIKILATNFPSLSFLIFFSLYNPVYKLYPNNFKRWLNTWPSDFQYNNDSSFIKVEWVQSPILLYFFFFSLKTKWEWVYISRLRNSPNCIDRPDEFGPKFGDTLSSFFHIWLIK